MSCTNSICLDQLLEPDPVDTFIILNNAGSTALQESGAVALPLGAVDANVVFTSVKASSGYVFNELAIQNTLDVTPLSLLPTLLSKSLYGFVVGLSGATDSSNYVLKWDVEVKELT